MRDSRLLPEARQEFRAAVLHYRSKEADVGVRFAETVREGIRFACANPETPPVEHGYHKLVLRGPFPYTLWFREEEGIIVVAAVWAQVRNLEIVRRRLLDR